MKRCTYYQDWDKRYPFHTNERGFGLLTRLIETNRKLLQINCCLIEESAAEWTMTATSMLADVNKSNCNGDKRDITGECDYDAKDVIVWIGQGLYAHKPGRPRKTVTQVSRGCTCR